MSILFKRLSINNQSELFKCNKCGTVDGKKNFPAFGVICKILSRPNHFAIICRSNKMDQEISSRYVHTIDVQR